MIPPISPKSNPSPSQPGTLAQQFATIEVAIYLGDQRDTSAAAEWSDARRLVIPHAARGDR